MFPFEDEDDELAQDDYGKALRPGEFQLEDGAAPGTHTIPPLHISIWICVCPVLQGPSTAPTTIIYLPLHLNASW